MRSLFLIHRYLGIGVGALMTVWCLSGIVMMYAPYPRLNGEERVASLEPVDWTRIGALGGEGFPADDARVIDFELEMLSQSPVLRLQLAGEPARSIGLSSGVALSRIEPRQALDVAALFAARRGLHSEHPVLSSMNDDQWTVGEFKSDRPLYRVELNDVQRTELYISSHTGRLVQMTTGSQRFWGWLGAVPHWLYPTLLRQHPQAWSRVVIWTSLLGSFLTATGLFIGIVQLRRKREGLGWESPYGGLLIWHHVPGLFFGPFALAWVFSGLLSMTPWGVLQGGDTQADFARLRGQPATFGEVRRLIQAVAAQSPQPLKSLESAQLGGTLFAVGRLAGGARLRVDAQGSLAPLSGAEIKAAATRLAGPQASWQTLVEPDAYHYSLMQQLAPLPALRITAADSKDYYYLDATSAALVDKADAAMKRYRWWHSGLHRLDFAPAFRTSTARNLLMLPLLLGVTLVCGIGAYMGVRRLGR